METQGKADFIVRGFAFLRGAMLLLFAVVFIAAPEKMIPGGSADPARTLALTFGSRLVLFGAAFIVLAWARRWEALAWLLIADALLQVFDTGMALATGKGALALVPAVIGALEVWAGMVLLRANRHPKRE